MRNPNPTRILRAKNMAAMAIVVFGLIGLFDMAETKAQSSPLENSPFKNRLAPRVGEIKSERIYIPKKPTVDRITSTSKTQPKTAASTTPPTKPATKTKPATPKVKEYIALSKTAGPAKKQIAARPNQTVVAKKNLPKKPLPKTPVASTTASTSSLLPPTVVVRPSVTNPDHLNQCVVEISEIKATNDVNLKVAIPDSVTMIEVVPNRNSNAARSFRIKMEQGVQIEEETAPAPISRQAQRQRRRELEEQPRPPITSGPPSVAYDPAPHTYRRGFSKNPFFVEKVVEKVAEVHRRPIEPAYGNAPREKKSLNSPRYRSHSNGVRDFFQRTSHSRLVDSAQQAEVQELAFEPVPQQTGFAHSFLPTKPVIAAQIIGPPSIDIGQTADFMIAIVNPMNTINRDLKIELDVPRGLEVVLLDRVAHFNDRTGTLYWNVNEIQPGEEVRLKYRVKSMRKGKQFQRVAVRIQDELLETHEVVTIAKLNLDAGASELPFDD